MLLFLLIRLILRLLRVFSVRKILLLAEHPNCSASLPSTFVLKERFISGLSVLLDADPLKRAACCYVDTWFPRRQYLK